MTSVKSNVKKTLSLLAHNSHPSRQPLKIIKDANFGLTCDKKQGTMRSRLNAIQKGFARLTESRKLATKSPYCQPHMNELPVPCGPWDPWYRKKQSFYMKHLLGGLAWWLFSFGLALYTDSLYLNWGPPKFPAPPSDMVDECDDSDS